MQAVVGAALVPEASTVVQVAIVAVGEKVVLTDTARLAHQVVAVVDLVSMPLLHRIWGLGCLPFRGPLNETGTPHKPRRINGLCYPFGLDGTDAS
jgi:hypothetical protein